MDRVPVLPGRVTHQGSGVEFDAVREYAASWDPQSDEDPDDVDRRKEGGALREYDLDADLEPWGQAAAPEAEEGDSDAGAASPTKLAVFLRGRGVGWDPWLVSKMVMGSGGLSVADL